MQDNSLNKLSHAAVSGRKLRPIIEDSVHDTTHADFWKWAHDATAARALAQGWSKDDIIAACIQDAFLSAASDPLNVDLLEEGESATSPAAFAHNAPWNDWTPPSQSRERFERAQANKQSERVEQRVRVRVCASPDADGQRNGVIAFASVEIIGGKRCLQLQRGSAILASMTIASLHIAVAGARIIVLAPRPHSKMATRPVVYLSFEDQGRVAKFGNMLSK
jgi:hypothetical protein